MTSWNKIEINENMILSIDIPLFFLDWGGIRIEDGFKITNSGNSALQNIQQYSNHIQISGAEKRREGLPPFHQVSNTTKWNQPK